MATERAHFCVPIPSRGELMQYMRRHPVNGFGAGFIPQSTKRITFRCVFWRKAASA